MPRFDGTGPVGRGPFSGGGRGYCAAILPPDGSDLAPFGYAGLEGTFFPASEDQSKGGVTMPFRDATGPRSAGPMTGRNAGYCAGEPFPHRFWRRGGHGFRNSFHATGSPFWARGSEVPAAATSNQEALREQLSWLEAQAERIKGLLREMPEAE